MADGNIFPSWSHRNRLPLVMQNEAAECALACLTMIACYYGHETDLASLRRRFSTSLKGVSLTRVIEIARTLGFKARPLRSDLEYLSQAQMPCILHWDMSHFVVLSSVTRKGAEIYDPARGRYRISLAELSKHFTGVLLEIAPGADFVPIRERQHAPLHALTGKVTGITRVIFHVFSLALAIEILSLILPFQLQWVVDQVLVSVDKNLLILMTLGFLIVTLLQAGLSMARVWVLSWLGATINAQWTTSLFSHLLKLPLGYFEKRYMGDIMSRFTSLQSIQSTLTGSFVEAILDGIMGTLTLIVLYVYSLPLTFCVLAVFVVYALLRFIFYQKLKLINEEQLIYGARQQTELMESIRGVQAIKLANQQSYREARLSNATQEATKRTLRSQRIVMTFGVINRSIFSIQRIVLIALGAYFSIEGKFSAGMLIAFVAYADQFSNKFGDLVDKVVEFRMLRLHADRIADVALTEPEQYVHAIYSGIEPELRIVVKNLSFRYAEGEPWIFKNISLTIEPGESVAIIGASGCGKSTLAKLLLGLLTPVEGVIEIGGVDIRRYGLERYRKRLSAVMQDDTLFAGTIADNISFFNSASTIEEIVSAAMTANIHDEIMAMTMAYETLVGDMGSTLSGGQRQRLILARALFRSPELLVLDEATSNLDGENEALINQAITQLKITRVIIAHRQETIASAHRIIDLNNIQPLH